MAPKYGTPAWERRLKIKIWWSRYDFPIVMLGLISVLIGLFVWLTFEQSAMRLRDCTSVCESHGHDRFAIEGDACFCAGPEGAYSPGRTDIPSSSTVVAPVIMPVRTR